MPWVLRHSIVAGLAMGLGMAPWTSLVADEALGLGLPASQEQIARLDTDVDAQGRGLPPGRGDVAAGEAVYQQECAACHGLDGRQGSTKLLAAEAGETPPNERSIRNWWPYAPTLFDYIRRAMPEGAAGSLSDNDVYAVTAYLLYREGLVERDISLGPQNLAGIRMPAADRFKPSAELEVPTAP